jgi:branched-chain amino acid transport system substrate-binding protein
MDLTGVSQMKKVVCFIVTLLIVAVAISLLISSCSSEKSKVPIGAVIAVTGPASSHVDVRDGMILAVEEVNHRGGINGRKIDLVVRDSESNPDVGVEAFEDIEKREKPIIYFSTSSMVSKAISPLTEKNGVVLMGLVVSDTNFTRDREWTYRFYPTSEDEVLSISYLTRYLKIERLGILYQDEAYGISVKDLLEADFTGGGGVVVAESFNVTDPDYTGSIQRLMDIEAVCIIGYSGNIAPALKQLRELGYSGIVIGSSGFAGLVGEIPEVNDIYIAAPTIYDEDYRYVMELKEKYKSKYNREITHYAATGYEAIHLMSGLLTGEELSRENVRAVLERGFIFPCVFGTIEVKQGEHDIPTPLVPAYVNDNEIEYIK